MLIGARTQIGINPIGNGNSDVVSTVLCGTCQMHFGPVEDFHFYSKTDKDCEFVLNRDVMDEYIAKADNVSDVSFKFAIEKIEDNGDSKKNYMMMNLHCLSCLRTKNDVISSLKDEEITSDNTEVDGRDESGGNELTGSVKRRKLEKLDDLSRNGEEKMIKIKSSTKIGGLVEGENKCELCVFSSEKLCFKTSDGVISRVKSWSVARVSPLFRDVNEIRLSVKL